MAAAWRGFVAQGAACLNTFDFMFTGIIEETGKVEKINTGGDAIELVVRARTCGRGLKKGDSVALNGCCLTAVRFSSTKPGRLIHFDLLRETWDRTNLQFLKKGALVNLERALRADGRLGGHFVTGHIDGIGRITRWERMGTDYLLEVAAAPELMRSVVFKGSIAVDGISLTVAAVRKGGFRVWVIPHTRAVTSLPQRLAGDAVNLETDLLGKYVERLLHASSP